MGEGARKVLGGRGKGARKVLGRLQWGCWLTQVTASPWSCRVVPARESHATCHNTAREGRKAQLVRMSPQQGTRSMKGMVGKRRRAEEASDSFCQGKQHAPHKTPCPGTAQARRAGGAMGCRQGADSAGRLMGH